MANLPRYIWPAVLPFARGLFLTFRNFYGTVKRRSIGEIGISNWYILAALVWTLVLVTIGYRPGTRTDWVRP